MTQKIDKWMILSIMTGWLLVSACSTPGTSAGAGAAIGAGAGATVGLLADPGDGGSHHIRNVLIGTGVGGALGAGAGLLIGNSVESQRQAALAQGKNAALEDSNGRGADGTVSQPKLVPAKTEARWVGDQIHGNVFVPAHFEYLIIEPSHWQGGK